MRGTPASIAPALNDTVFGGYNTPVLWGWLGPATIYHDPDERFWEFDPEVVQMHLNAGGFEDGFEFDVSVNAADLFRHQPGAAARQRSGVQDAFRKVEETFELEPRTEAMRELNRLAESRSYDIKTHYRTEAIAHDPVSNSSSSATSSSTSGRTTSAG